MIAPRAVSAGGSRRHGAFLERAPSASIPVGATTGSTRRTWMTLFRCRARSEPASRLAQAPFICVRQLDDIASRWIACKSIEGAYDAALDWRVETLEIAPCPCRENPAAAGAQATSRLISSAEITSPRAICALASRAPSSSSGVVGSSESSSTVCRSFSFAVMPYKVASRPAAPKATALRPPVPSRRRAPGPCSRSAWHDWHKSWHAGPLNKRKPVTVRLVARSGE